MSAKTKSVQLFLFAVFGVTSTAFAQFTSAPTGPGGTWVVYQLVTPNQTWDQSRVNAYGMSFGSTPGHLATITSDLENSVVYGRANLGDAWIGLTDSNSTSTIDSVTLTGTEAGSNPNGGWVWSNGEPFAFQRFASGEPNDSGDGEDAAQIRSDGLWNDHEAGSTLGANQSNQQFAYVVEYNTNSVFNPLAIPGGSYWTHRLIDVNDSFSNGDNDGEVDDVNEGDYVLSNAPRATDGSYFPTYYSTTNTINLTDGSIPGFTGDDFVMESTGIVDVLSGTSGTFTLYVNGDDGFRLRRNGVVIGEFVGPTGGSNTTINNVLLTDGDVLSLVFFERAGGNFSQLRINDGNGAFLGDPASGIEIIPEPSSFALASVGMLMMFSIFRKRRIA